MQMTLGALITELEKLPPECDVYFGFGFMAPTKLDSYRGYYDHLALGYQQDGDMTAGQLLAECREALHATFQGYKGGDYRMRRTTPVWIANYGRTSDTILHSVLRLGETQALLITRHEDEHD